MHKDKRLEAGILEDGRTLKCRTCAKRISAASQVCDDCRRIKHQHIYISGRLTPYSEITRDAWFEHFRKPDSKVPYDSARNGIARFARRVYEESGGPRKCYLCPYSKTVDICHLTGVMEFPGTATLGEINHVSNLVALCKNHHNELDKGLLDPQDADLIDALRRTNAPLV